MQIRTFEPHLDEETAVEHTRNLSAWRYARSWMADRFGLAKPTVGEDVYAVYYPDYIAYTSLTIRRVVRGSADLRFLAGIDAVTGDVGEVDVDLPERRTEDVAADRIVAVELTEDDAYDAWREWLFTYASRNHRAIKVPEYSLDRLELVYTPYWIVDGETAEESLAISDLTRRAARIDEIEVLREFYESHRSEADA